MQEEQFKDLTLDILRRVLTSEVGMKPPSLSSPMRSSVHGDEADATSATMPLQMGACQLDFVRRYFMYDDAHTEDAFVSAVDAQLPHWIGSSDGHCVYTGRAADTLTGRLLTILEPSHLHLDKRPRYAKFRKLDAVFQSLRKTAVNITTTLESGSVKTFQAVIYHR